MILNITDKCSKGCNHCIGEHNIYGKHMDISMLDDVASFIKWTDPGILIISGGEPTEHPHFFDIMEYLVRISEDIGMAILSNGTFLEDKTFAEKLFGMGIVVQITNDKRYYPKRILIDGYVSGRWFLEKRYQHFIHRVGRMKFIWRKLIHLIVMN